ncbi:MAG: cytochrome c oxidase subunit [Acidobacteriota bacterium]|jgi:cytochrome c oxidase subunit 2|nr:cytochrome c oxidase subunit [Acidobacteriota bacterium]
MGRALGVLIWLLTLASVVLFFSGWWFPVSITEHAPAIDRQFMITMVVVGIAFVLAQVGLGYVVWRFGANREKRDERAVYTHGNNRLEMIWTVVTAVVFISLGVMGQRVWAQLHFSDAPAGSFPVEVVAQQFAWNMHYAGRDGKFGRTDPTLIKEDENNFIGLDEKDPNAKDDLTTTTLVIPVNHPVELILRSKDVTHSFWVPQLRFKQDLVPGMAIRVHFTPTRTGQFQLACAELCGMNHFSMKGTLLVLTEEQHRDLIALPQSDFQTKVNELKNAYEVGVIYDEKGTKIGSSY